MTYRQIESMNKLADEIQHLRTENERLQIQIQRLRTDNDDLRTENECLQELNMEYLQKPLIKTEINDLQDK
mgnify:CR=1 FL=1